MSEPFALRIFVPSGDPTVTQVSGVRRGYGDFSTQGRCPGNRRQ